MRRNGDEGSGSIWVLCSALVVMAIAIGLLTIGAALDARRAVQNAADQAALAAASRVLEGSVTACATATDIARRNGAIVTDCQVVDSTARISVQWDKQPALLRSPIRAKAAAGPAS